MFQTALTTRMTATYAAAVLVASLAASLISVGTAAAQAGAVTVTITNKGKTPISMHIQGLRNYIDDFEGGQTKSVPAANLAGITPNNNIQWEARTRDLQNVNQARTTVCARGVVIFSGQTGHIDVTKCDQNVGVTPPPPVSVTLQQAYGKQWGDFCLSKGSAPCCTAPERFSGTPECKTRETCRVSVHICETMVACDAAQNNCRKTATGAAIAKCTSDYKACHDKALTLSN
jgi:hypothetical protein